MTISTNTKLREFKESDIEPLQELIYETIDISYFSIYPRQAINFFKGFHSVEKIIERAHKGKTIIVEKDKVIIGTGSFLNGEILGVFIKPTFQNHGCGKKLMLELEKIASALNCTKVSLSVSLPSRKFYEGLDYKILKECCIEVKNGERLAYWTASKELKQNPNKWLQQKDKAGE